MTHLALRLLALVGATAVSVAAGFLGLLWLSSRDLAEPDPYVITGI